MACVDDIISSCVANRDPSLSLQYSGEDGMAIAASMAKSLDAGKLAHVTSLDVGGNALEPVAVHALCDLVLPRLPNLEELDLRHNELGSDGAEALRAVFGSGPGARSGGRSSKSLRRLYVGENRLQDEGAYEILHLLVENGHVEELSLGSNGLTIGIAGIIGETIAAPSVSATLKVLHLEYNALGDVGCRQLFDKLSKVRHVALRELSLGDNSIGDEGVVSAIMPFLQSKNQVLESLDLSVNRISAMGASAFASVIATTTTLQHLDLGCNPLTLDGLRAIAVAMHTHTSFESIDLTSTGMNDDVMRLMTAAYERNVGLIKISIGNNDDASADVRTRLAALMDQCRASRLAARQQQEQQAAASDARDTTSSKRVATSGRDWSAAVGVAAIAAVVVVGLALVKMRRNGSSS